MSSKSTLKKICVNSNITYLSCYALVVSRVAVCMIGNSPPIKCSNVAEFMEAGSQDLSSGPPLSEVVISEA